MSVAPAPNVHQHEAQRTAQERQGDQGTQGDQDGGAEKQKPNEVGPMAGIVVLLQHAGVACCKDQVEEKVDAKRAKVGQRGGYAPDLSLEHQPKGQEQLDRMHQACILGQGEGQSGSSPEPCNGGYAVQVHRH